MNLKSIFDEEILKLHAAVDRDATGDAEECWESYKIPIFELGFDVVNEMQILSLYEAGKLMKEFERMRLNISANVNQLITDLSMASSTIFLARFRVNFYVSSN